jgi:uncharacterized membrane protein YcaP (DUF421 family)
MDWLYDLDRTIVEPNVSLLEIFLRGTIMYLGLFVLIRVVLKRESGGVGISDLLVVVLIADAAQNGMAGEYLSVPEGLLLVTTILGWAYVIDWMTFHVPFVRDLVVPAPLPLVVDGALQYRNMRRELITREELQTHLREQGIESVSEVKVACMESDGRISVVKADDGDNQNPARERTPA